MFIFKLNINTKLGNEFEAIYNRNDMLGSLARRCLYGPTSSSQANGSTSRPGVKRDLKRRLIYDEDVNFEKPRVNLRKMASYKFIFNLSLCVLLVRLFTGFSYVSIVILVSFFFFFYSLLKKQSQQSL